MKSETLTLLGGRTAEAFLRDYWQKRPCLIRKALPDVRPLLSAEELAGLACEDGIESRLVRSDLGRWTLEHGPLPESRFAELPERDWTLLVQDVEKWVPEYRTLLDRFRFIPDWRIDDLMVSYAADGGGVGPHTDAYDVFLLQLEGRRRWSIDPSPANLECLPDLPLGILADFTPRDSFELMPGDMLYLPPGVAHDGVAIGPCMTASIGFRAPAVNEMFIDLAEWLSEQLQTAPESRYADPDLHPVTLPGRIAPESLARIRTLLHGVLQPDSASLNHWFGRYITEPKPWLQPDAPELPLSAEALVRKLQHQPLQAHPATELAWVETTDGLLWFVNGQAFPLPKAAPERLAAICRARQITGRDAQDITRLPGGDTILYAVYCNGAFEFEDGDGG